METMTIREISESLGVSRGLIEKRVRELFPGRMRHGVTTNLTELEVTAISIRLKQNTSLISKNNCLERISFFSSTSHDRKELIR